jgi:hypothetical protein
MVHASSTAPGFFAAAALNDTKTSGLRNPLRALLSFSLGMTQKTKRRKKDGEEGWCQSSRMLRPEEYHRRVKTNPFPWFPWWPKVEESHYIPIIIIAAIGAAILIYFSGL